MQIKWSGKRFAAPWIRGLFQTLWRTGPGAGPVLPTITVRDFQGNTSTQTVDKTPAIYVIGPAQSTLHFQPTSFTQIITPGPHQGLYIREREAAYTADGNVWFRWEEDQPVIGVAPTTYRAGVF